MRDYVDSKRRVVLRSCLTSMARPMYSPAKALGYVEPSTGNDGKAHLMDSSLLGFALVFTAAVAGGALAVPLKRRRKFELENIYLPSTVVMMLILPLGMATLVMPNWLEAMHAVGAGVVLRGVAYGFGWGIGAILFGYGVTMAGMSVGFATIMGINTAVGSFLPLLLQSSAYLFTTGGCLIMVGIAGCVAGVVVCGRGGLLRERQIGFSPKDHRFGRALLVCVASGLLSSCANLGFAFTSRAGEEAQRLGASPVFSTLASWLPVFWGAAASLLFWFGGLQIWRGTWRNNIGSDAVHDWLNGALMGVIWFVATIPYGMGAYYLGRLGTSVGWAVYLAFTLLVANLFGFITHEWKGTSVKARRTLYAGLSVLLVAVFVLAIGNSMTGH
ncbi:MAG: L-rhamnose/proton symporter RhaT [Acidobacteriaceae bacterium]